ncbi:hypothetical protein BDZ94DRAFT_1315875 [Collybia nuda]|uniref:Uncharacterized protein n=1 Tax=Collybia nuda TaxID=64659 RepID=A0A9P5XS52_9AGAR|nr:hypothetical protein BDZ94DRAFT_1315875 [Collybia nuda]
MALSVSGFPEPLRQLPDPDVDSSILANNPRLRGFFGKKSDSRSPTRYNIDEFQYNPPSPPSTTPRSSHMPSPSSDEQAFLVQMAAMQTPEPLPTIPQRQRQISLTRRTPPPPVRRQPSLGRLEIGMGPRAPAGGPSLHVLPKPPTVVVQEWSTRNIDPTLPLPRPLPAVPNPGPIVESSKSAAMRNMQQRIPSSKVLMTSPSRPRAQTTAPQGVNVRYQSMVTDTTEKEIPSCSPPSSSPNLHTSPGGQIRPLPRIPPATTTSTSPPVQLPRHVPRPARSKRPRTSPSPSDGFTTSVRSQFDAVPSSWASRPVDLNPSQPAQATPSSNHTSPPNPANLFAHASSSSQAGPSNYAGPPARPVPPRTRSHSRPRRDHSADANSSGSRTPTSNSRRPAHRVTSPLPIIPNPAITPPPSARNSASIRASTYHVTVKSSFSPTTSPKLVSAPASTNRFLSDRGGVITAPPSKVLEAKPRTAADVLTLSDDLLHSHPLGSLSNDEPPSPVKANETPEPPLEVFIDDEDYSAVLSRSPSPMRYARPSSRGSLSDDSFTESRSRSRAIRDQLRSFRKSYRGPKSPSRSPSPIRYARRSSLDGLDEPTTSVSPKRRMQPRSYQFDYKAAQDSSPFNRNVTPSSTEGKAGSSKTRRGQSKGSGDSRPSRSTSPRRSRFSTPSGSVIDISLPATLASSYQDLVKKGHSRSSTENIRLRTSDSSSRSNGNTTSWNKSMGSWSGVSAGDETQLVYKDDTAVVVTTIQPSRDVWKEEEMKRVIPKLRHLKARN